MGYLPSDKLTLKEAALWVIKNRKLAVTGRYLHDLCLSNRIKSEIIGKMRFIDLKSLEDFNGYRKPGRPKK